MKRAIFLSAFMIMAIFSYSQFTIGPKIGFTMSKLTTDINEITEEAKSGFQIGAFARFGKKVYLQPEVMFMTQGGNLKLEGTDVKTSINLNTVQIPVMVGYKLLNLKVVGLRVLGGPAVSMVVNKEIDIDENVQNPISEDDIKDGIWTFDLGVGVDVLMFTLDVRYEWGLNNIWDGEGSYDMKNNLWNISLGWMIL